MAEKQRMSTKELLLLIAVLFFALLYIGTIFTRFPNGDEGLQAEHVYFLDELGYVKSDIWAGYGYDWEVRQYHYHKGLILMGWGAMKILGFSLPAFRLVAVFFFLLMLYFIYRYIYDLNIAYKRLLFLTTVLVLLVSNVFAEFGLIFRPEIVIMSLGIGSFYYLRKGVMDEKIKYIILSGVLVGLGAFTHLIGLVLILAGGLTLVYFGRIKYSLVYGLFALLALGLYGWDLLSGEAFQGFLYQFTNEASLAEKQEHFFSRILNEHMRYFSSEREAMFSLFFFVGLVINFKYLHANFKMFLIYGLASMLSMMIISHTITPKYALLFFVFMSFVCAVTLLRLRHYRKFTRGLVVLLAVVFFGYHTYRDLKLCIPRINVAARNAEIAEYMPEKGTNVATFSTFVFNEIENYTIHGFLAIYRYYTKNHPGYQRTPDDMFAFCDNMNDRYILIDRLVLKDKFFDFVYEDEVVEGMTWGNYKLIVQKDDFWLWENIRLKEE